MPSSFFFGPQADAFGPLIGRPINMHIHGPTCSIPLQS